MNRLKKGFTLIELMIVIGIIGILSAILLKAVSGSSDSAQAAKCLANMRDLANACQATALANGEQRFPYAGSSEYANPDVDFSSGVTLRYREAHGWISWASMDAYRSLPKQSQYSSSWLISTYEKSEEKRLHALTNGAIWKAISGNASSYRCPIHVECAKKKNCSPVWSYVMNGYFGYHGCSKPDGEKHLQTISNRDRRLLFAELPFNVANASQSCKYATSSGIDLDPTLQYKKNEYIGFNHKTKRKWYAHVCFADGHTEKLELPGNASLAQLRKLTTWLCEGTEITYNGTKYEEAK